MKRKILLFLSLTVAAAIFFAGCQQERGETIPDAEVEYPAEVSSLGVVNRFAGVVTSSGETKIEKDDAKTVSEVLVSAGDDVKEGQTLFTYDGTQAQLNYDKAALELEQLRLTLDSYYEQKSGLENEKARAEASEQLSYTLQIQEIETSIREANYNIGVKEKEVEKLEKGLDELEIKSPITGKVQSINAEGGNDANGNALPFMVLMNTGTYRIKAYVNEQNAQDLVKGDSVIIRSRTNDDTWTGTVASIDFDNPSKSQQIYSEGGDTDVSSSSKYPFYVELENADGLILGQHVFVECELPEAYDGVLEEGLIDEGLVDEGVLEELPEGVVPDENENTPVEATQADDAEGIIEPEN